MSTQTNACPIWGPGEGRATKQGLGIIYVEDAHRAGGQYVIDREALYRLGSDPSVKRDPTQVKARLTTILVNEREHGEAWPMVTPERIEEAKQAAPLPVPERAERLLRYLAKCSAGEIGSKIPIREPLTPEYKGALAWSESTGWNDIVFLSDYLSQKGWVDIAGLSSKSDPEGVTVTVDGYARIESLKTNPDSAQAFVAMWIDDETYDAYKKGIEPAIEQSGFNSMRIDQKADANKLDDDIIAEIRRSRFLVADMTHGKDGARGSVYFEAGFATGLDIPIIYTCRRDLIDKVHFDIRQYAHILWETPEELRKGLIDKIQARIEEGTNVT